MTPGTLRATSPWKSTPLKSTLKLAQGWPRHRGRGGVRERTEAERDQRFASVPAQEALEARAVLALEADRSVYAESVEGEGP